MLNQLFGAIEWRNRDTLAAIGALHGPLKSTDGAFVQAAVVAYPGLTDTHYGADLVQLAERCDPHYTIMGWPSAMYHGPDVPVTGFISPTLTLAEVAQRLQDQLPDWARIDTIGR